MSKRQVHILKGTRNSEEVKDAVFTVLTQNRDEISHYFVVDGKHRWGRDRVRVRVYNEQDYKMVLPGRKNSVTNTRNFGITAEQFDQAEVVSLIEPKEPEAVVVEESDEEVTTRIAARFEIMDEMARAVINNDVRALIITGPAGVGKSYSVLTQIDEAGKYNDEHEKDSKYEVIKGACTAFMLYIKLHEHKDDGHIVVFDDCDQILQDEISLNILKAALDSGSKKRRIFWNSDSSKLKNEGIPNHFDFKGSIIFITNINFEKLKGKQADTTASLMSRCHYLDLTLNTMRDKLLRIKQIAESGNLFKGRYLGEETELAIIQFMVDNQDKLREVSLRMALKIADLVKVGANWKRLAMMTCTKSS